jgi:hypothetical protein
MSDITDRSFSSLLYVRQHGFGTEPRVKLRPALYQSDALVTERRRTLTELRRTLTDLRRTLLSYAAPIIVYHAYKYSSG